MEIVKANCGSLSNFEVMEHLKKIKDSRKQQKGQLATITYETLRYLEGTACALQSPESITKCVQALKQFNLNSNEILTIINLPPTTALEIQLMVEESEERLTEGQVDSILQIVAQQFPHTQKNQEENEAPEQE